MSGIADQLQPKELIVNNQEFIRRLMDLFRICKNLENIDDLHSSLPVLVPTVQHDLNFLLEHVVFSL